MCVLLRRQESNADLRRSTLTGTFTILAHTNDSPDVAIPATWDDADPHLIDKGKVEQVRLRSFSTNVHSLEVCHAVVPTLSLLTIAGHGGLSCRRVMCRRRGHVILIDSLSRRYDDLLVYRNNV